jgi:hypothetical protein
MPLWSNGYDAGVQNVRFPARPQQTLIRPGSPGPADHGDASRLVPAAVPKTVGDNTRGRTPRSVSASRR